MQIITYYPSWIHRIVVGLGLMLGVSIAVYAIIADFGLIETLHKPQAEHAEQKQFHDLVANGNNNETFDLAFELGDELFETAFNAIDGVGANVGQGQRFTRVPRADLNAPDEWASHLPAREGGPNAEACDTCHNTPFSDGAGLTSSNVHRDPQHSADLRSFIVRNPPHLFGLGALQRLAEEMTEDLHQKRDAAVDKACLTGKTKTIAAKTKGVGFGRITVHPIQKNPCEVDIDLSEISGVDTDLVVKPFQWKGIDPTVREFNREASNNELGMQSVELVGAGQDGDFDGVTDELTVGDQTALAVYLAAQPRPTSKLELHRLGLMEPLSLEQIKTIRRGKRVFAEIDCVTCHRPQLKIHDPIFSEPSQNPNYRDTLFPAGQDPLDEWVDPEFPVTFDLTADQPDNVVEAPDGSEIRLGSLKTDRKGSAVVSLFGDLKSHDMGPELAETIDEVGTGASTWITKELWGLGSTAPYLHDGRATTVTEAILAHGGEGEASQLAFKGLAPNDQAALIAFLENLVLFKVEEEE